MENSENEPLLETRGEPVEPLSASSQTINRLTFVTCDLFPARLYNLLCLLMEVSKSINLMKKRKQKYDISCDRCLK